jgi:hypothetical protein
MTERGAGQSFPFHSLFWLRSGCRSGTRVEYSGGTFRIYFLHGVSCFFFSFLNYRWPFNEIGQR